MSLHRNLIIRRILLRGAAASVAPVLAHDDWPNHPVRLIVPYPAGGSTDVLFRMLADRMKDRLRQPIVIENRSGASGNVGIDAVAISAPDGTTIGGADGRAFRDQSIPRREHAV
jgi:tripartite-type tricarboxylate transporter receptor subunit TctC